MILLKPGTHRLDVNVGFFTQVTGLGRWPDDVTVLGHVHAEADWAKGMALVNFWRSVENMAVRPPNGADRWAVSQAAPYRRMHLTGDLALDDGGWSSGGFMADCRVDGTVRSGSQQQWFTRTSRIGAWPPSDRPGRRGRRQVGTLGSPTAFRSTGWRLICCLLPPRTLGRIDMDEDHSALCLGAGTYHGGGGRGIYSVCRNTDRQWTTTDAYEGALNASFSVYSARYGIHYVVDEQPTGSVGVFRYRDRTWEKLASMATNGAAPCHVALDRSETLLAVANYGSGSVSLVHLDERTGLPVGRVQVRSNSGSGPNLRRQDGPHAHWVGFSGDGRWLYQTDLGTDEILAFSVDRHAGLGPPHRAYAAPPGSGPRHLLLHPRLDGVAYLAGELASTLTMLDYAGGAFTDPRIVPTLPNGWRGENIVAHLATNRAADRLYVSNRGHDSIAVFALDAVGFPTLMQHVPAGGAFPRFFLLLEDQHLMMVANEKSQTLSALVIGDDGLLSTTGVTLPIPGLAYLLMAEPAAFHRSRGSGVGRGAG